MLSRRLKAQRAQFIATTLSVGLLLACGDDDSTDEVASTAEDGGPSSSADEAGSSGRASGGRAGSTTTGSGGTSGEAPAAAGQSGESDDGVAGGPAPTDEAVSGDEDAGSGEPQPEVLKVAVRFKARLGKEDFACGHKYAGQGSAQTTVAPRDLRMFVHDVALIAADGTKVPVKLGARAPWQSETLALLDFEDKTGRCVDGTAEVNTALTGTVPAGSYTGLSFVTGVPEALNHQDPQTAGDPLQSAAGLSSSTVEGFRFAKIEVVQLAAADQPAGSGVFQLGSTGCASATDGTITCAKPNRTTVQLDAFDSAKNSVVIDVGTLFATLDLGQAQECHSTEPVCESMLAATGIDLATGEAKAGQTLFKVE